MAKRIKLPARFMMISCVIINKVCYSCKALVIKWVMRPAFAKAARHLVSFKAKDLMEISEIKALVELFERSTLTELVIERGGTKLTLKRQAPNKFTTHVEETAPQTNQTAGAGLALPLQQTDRYAIKSPIVGIFYRRPAPNEEPYVEVGDRVEVGDTVCIIEAMKVMNEVKTEKAGVVYEILAEDGKPVEYGQELMVIKTI